MSVTAADLKKVFAKAVPADVMAKIDPAQPMAAQGVDSLAITAMAVALQHAYGVTVTPEDGVRLKTLNDVAAWVNTVKAAS